MRCSSAVPVRTGGRRGELGERRGAGVCRNACAAARCRGKAEEHRSSPKLELELVHGGRMQMDVQRWVQQAIKTDEKGKRMQRVRLTLGRLMAKRTCSRTMGASGR